MSCVPPALTASALAAFKALTYCACRVPVLFRLAPDRRSCRVLDLQPVRLA